MSANASGVDAGQALGEHHAVGADHLDRVVGVERADHLGDPGGQQRRPATEQGLAGALVDHDGAARTDGEGDPELAGRQVAVVGQHHGADAGGAGHRVDEHRVTGGGRDHRAHPRPRRDLGRRQLGGHAAAAPGRARAPGPLLELVIDLDDLLDERGAGVEAGIGGEHAGRVGEQHERVGADEVGHQGGQAVVVAEADLVVGDGVVLVHDGHHAQLEQAQQRAAGLEVLAPLHEVERGQQHLAGHQVVGAERVVVDLHQPALTHRRDRLQGDRVTGSAAAAQAERGQPGRDGPRADHHHLVAVGAQLGDLGAELGDGALLDDALAVGERRRADLGDDDHHPTSIRCRPRRTRRSACRCAPGRPGGRRPGPAPCRPRACAGERGRSRGPRGW